LSNGQLPANLFEVVATVAINMGRFTWVNRFIKKVSKYVPKESYQNSYYVVMARYYFALNDFEKALFYTRQISYSDDHYYFTSKLLFTMVYFETNDYKGLLSVLDNFYQYMLKKNNFNQIIEKQYKNYLKYMRKLAKIKFTPGENKYAELIALKKKLIMKKILFQVKCGVTQKLKRCKKYLIM